MHPRPFNPSKFYPQKSIFLPINIQLDPPSPGALPGIEGDLRHPVELAVEMACGVGFFDKFFLGLGI